MNLTSTKSYWGRAMTFIKITCSPLGGRGVRLLGALFLVVLGMPAFAEPVGTVVAVSGNVQAQSAAGPTARALVQGAAVERGDTLITGADSNLQIRFADNALLMVRPNSRIRVDDYRVQGNNLHSVMSLIAGGIRTLTGRIGKARRDAYVMNTPTATIGVRGTDYELRLCQANCPAGSVDGLYLGVIDGRIEARNEAGVFELAAHEYGLIRTQQAVLEKFDCAPEALTGVPCPVNGTPLGVEPAAGYRAGEEHDQTGNRAPLSRGVPCGTNRACP